MGDKNSHSVRRSLVLITPWKWILTVNHLEPVSACAACGPYYRSLQYENSKWLHPAQVSFPSSSRFRLLFAVAKFFHFSEKSSSQRAFLVDFLHPSTNPSSPRRPLYRANVVSQEPSFFVKFSVSSSSYSPILDRLPIHSRFLVFIPPLLLSG